MPSQEILCTVNGCYYWNQGNACAASRIMVRNNAETIGRGDMEIGTIGGEGEARTSNQTLCETFIPEVKGPKPGIDRITR